jgi:Fe-S oxidoreductase
MFVQDYQELGLPDADKLAARCFLFEEFVDDLLRREPGALRFEAREANVVVHAHCHTKAITGGGFLHRLAMRLPERRVTLLNTG